VTTPSLDDRIGRAADLLREIATGWAPAVFANSLGAEDMVLTDLIRLHAPSIRHFSLDTGRLPPETYDLMGKVEERYGVRIEIFAPEAAALEAFVADNGINAFYRSVELRRACCAVRKVAPLKRALAGRRAWVTGLRREQAVTRGTTAESEFDADYGLQKFNPLAEWTHADVWTYLERFDVPVNALHARGYPSIGCAPCTRAVAPGEDQRAGRWWWEQPEHKECGLHVRHGAAAVPQAGAAAEVGKIQTGRYATWKPR
jgi:phosphoadenosine phosphosulfate reductase